MRKLFKVSTKVALFNTESKVLVIHIDKTNDYGLPGGHIDEGEDIETALRRELLEECGIEEVELKKVDFFLHSNGKLILAFTGRLTSNEHLISEQNELEGTPKWLTMEEFKAIPIEPNYKSFVLNNWPQLDSSQMILCRDINGDVHIVNQAELIQRTSAYGVIEDENGVLLVRDRTRTDEKWDLPGGGIDPDEELLDALKREIKEETDLDIADEPQKICEFTEYFYDVDSEEGWESTRHFYKVAPSGVPHLQGNGDDVVEARYFKQPLSPSEIAPVAREIFRMAANLR